MKESLLGKIVTAILLPLGILGFVGIVLKAYQKVIAGRGLETYINGWGVEVNYIGILSVLILIPIVLTAGWLINYVMTRDERRLKKEIDRQQSQKNNNNK
jgi:hypothetical protein